MKKSDYESALAQAIKDECLALVSARRYSYPELADELDLTLEETQLLMTEPVWTLSDSIAVADALGWQVELALTEKPERSEGDRLFEFFFK